MKFSEDETTELGRSWSHDRWEEAGGKILGNSPRPTLFSLKLKFRHGPFPENALFLLPYKSDVIILKWEQSDWVDEHLNGDLNNASWLATHWTELWLGDEAIRGLLGSFCILNTQNSVQWRLCSNGPHKYPIEFRISLFFFNWRNLSPHPDRTRVTSGGLEGKKTEYRISNLSYHPPSIFSRVLRLSRFSKGLLGSGLPYSSFVRVDCQRNPVITEKPLWLPCSFIFKEDQRPRGKESPDCSRLHRLWRCSLCISLKYVTILSGVQYNLRGFLKDA